MRPAAAAPTTRTDGLRQTYGDQRSRRRADSKYYSSDHKVARDPRGRASRVDASVTLCGLSLRLPLAPLIVSPVGRHVESDRDAARVRLVLTPVRQHGMQHTRREEQQLAALRLHPRKRDLAAAAALAARRQRQDKRAIQRRLLVMARRARIIHAGEDGGQVHMQLVEVAAAFVHVDP